MLPTHQGSVWLNRKNFFLPQERSSHKLQRIYFAIEIGSFVIMFKFCITNDKSIVQVNAKLFHAPFSLLTNKTEIPSVTPKRRVTSLWRNFRSVIPDFLFLCFTSGSIVAVVWSHNKLSPFNINLLTVSKHVNKKCKRIIWNWFIDILFWWKSSVFHIYS